jgi:hypothetical protein
MKQRKAFTIVELMLAMAFLGTLLLGIALLVMRISGIYQKGVAIRAINANGREIVSDLTRSINGSRVNIEINPTKQDIKLADINEARAAYYLATYDGGKQRGGVFCTGDYSYVWNTAENIRMTREKISDKNYTAANVSSITKNGVYGIHTADGKYMIPKLARFIDHDREACVSESTTGSGGKIYVPTKKGDMKENAYLFKLKAGTTYNDVTELIEDSESDLVLYNFTVQPATQHDLTKQIFYSGMFILATYRGGVNVQANGDFCQGSDKEDGSAGDEFTLNDFDYCAVNKFNFSARATGETGINKYGEK